MEFDSEKHGFILKQALETVEAALSENRWLDRKLRISAFAANYDGKWFNAFTIIRPVEQVTTPVPGSMQYSILRAQVQDVSLIELTKMLRRHDETGSIVIDGLEIHGKVNLDSWVLSRHAGGNIYDSRACLVCRGTPNPQYGFRVGSLLDYENPYFASSIDFVNDFTGLQLREHDDPVRSIAIVVPDIRAYFSGIEKNQNGFVVTVSGTGIDQVGLKIKGEISVDGTSKKIDSEVIKGKASINATLPVSAIRLWLIDSSSNVFDEYYEPVYFRDERAIRRTFNAISTASSAGLHRLVVNALNSGENEEVEFKPYIKITNQKIDELVPTILAFLNTRGGTIFMGITDGMEVEGIDKEVMQNAKNRSSLDAAIGEYIAELKQLINREIAGPYEIKYQPIEYLGRYLLVLSVLRGKARPHLRQGKKDCIYIRRGASNMQANRENIEAMFQSDNSGPLGMPTNHIFGSSD